MHSLEESQPAGSRIFKTLLWTTERATDQWIGGTTGISLCRALENDLVWMFPWGSGEVWKVPRVFSPDHQYQHHLEYNHQPHLKT